ncbi:MAG: hypothetical protein ABJG41_09910 [Cyclobacteriaceae bacterium]
MKMNWTAKVWLKAQGRRIVGFFILLFSRKFLVVGTWNYQKLMQSQHMPGHLGFVVCVTDIKKMDKLIERLIKIRHDLIHKSKHHDGITLRNNHKSKSK